MVDYSDLINMAIDGGKLTPQKPNFNINTQALKSMPRFNKIIPGISIGNTLGSKLSPIGWGSEAVNNQLHMAKDIWDSMNINTMDPRVRDAILKSIGKDDEINNYANKESTVDELMKYQPIISQKVAKFIAPSKKEKTNLDNGLAPREDLDKLGKSDLNSKIKSGNGPVSAKQQAQEIVNSVNNKTQDYSPLEDATTRVHSQDDINIVNDYLKRLQDATQPYIDMLSDYVDNYNTNLDDYRRARKFYTGLAGWSGNSRFADLAQDYNPFVIQSNRLALAKQMQDAMMNDINAINELQGNMALAKEMELPPEAAFANKNLLTALSQAKRYATDLEKARIVDAMRRYGYDRAYDKALAQQLLRNLGMENVANINAQAYGYGGMAPGVGLTQQGTVQRKQPKAGTMEAEFENTKR